MLLQLHSHLLESGLHQVLVTTPYICGMEISDWVPPQLRLHILH
ncbi:hypothetical protein ID866_13287 [Astraeus odoratus]|nr:hypothetical protein ID866_13287 [Astraeus odoratus]